MRGVKEVRVWHGKYIDAIQFAIKYGKESPKYGGNGGRADVFQVDDDEQILCVDVYANKLVDGLSFGTKEGTFQSKEGLAAGVAVKFKSARQMARTSLASRVVMERSLTPWKLRSQASTLIGAADKE